MRGTPVPELGLEQLKALTHPLRVQLLRALRTDGPATASLLGRRLGESSGATSYHLRQLEKHGFVEEVPDSGNGRDRWWRAAFRGHRVEAAQWLDDPEAVAVLAGYEANVVDVQASLAREFVESQAEWGPEWVDAMALNDYRFRLTPRLLRRLVDVVHREIERFEKYESEDGEQVAVVFQAFPRRVRPFTEEAE
jgi:DNA-binding transcriptional ArsR family regulator